MSSIIEWKFPHPPRPEQVTLNEFAIKKEDSPVILMEAPTGVGKSPVCVSLAHHWSGIILTPYNALQDQYRRDWPAIPILKGAINYQCGKITCKQGKAMKRKCDTCPYDIAKDRFKSGRASITNYAFWLTGKLETEHSTILCDEGHKLHDAVINAYTFTFNAKVAGECKVKWMPPPEKDSELMGFLEGYSAALTTRAAQYAETNPEFSIAAAQYAEACLNLIAALSRGEQVAIQCDLKMRTFAISPISCKGLWGETWKAMGKPRIVATSATFLDPDYVAQWFGVRPAFIQLESPFEPASRAVYYDPVANVKAADEESLGKVLRKIDTIMDEWKDERGLIHTPSYKMAEWLATRSRHKHRFTQLTRDNKIDELLVIHEKKPGSVLIGPNMMEGLDLKDDLARFNVITKMPFPPMVDPWVKKKNEVEPAWQPWHITWQLVQACGRVVRHGDDWGVTYIIDSNFGWFYGKNERLFPGWFKQGLVEV